MTGLVYKELKQNLRLVTAVLIFPGVIAFAGGAWYISEVGVSADDDTAKIGVLESIRSGQGAGIWLGFTVMAFVVAWVIQGTIFNGDSKKVWADFIAATPDGVKGYIRIKYELGLTMAVLTLFSVQLGDWIMTLICAAHKLEWFDMAQAMIMLSYVQLILLGFEFPFTVRFGVKNGSIIKTIAIAVVGIFILIVFTLRGEDIADAYVSGKLRPFGAFAQYIQALLPVISVGVYYLSYRLACGLYMKGAAQYDK